MNRPLEEYAVFSQIQEFVESDVLYSKENLVWISPVIIMWINEHVSSNETTMP